MGELWELFRAFFVIGGLTFGGGYAMLPMLEREVVAKRDWATQEELLDYFAIGQCTPGIIAINTATFIGFKRRGVAGATAAVLGMIAPSFVLITLIAMVLSNFMEIVWIQRAFAGIRVAVAALIAASVVKLVKSSVKNPLHIALCALAFVLIAFVNVSPIWVVLGAIGLGLLLCAGGEKA